MARYQGFVGKEEVSIVVACTRQST